MENNDELFQTTFRLFPHYIKTIKPSYLIEYEDTYKVFRFVRCGFNCVSEGNFATFEEDALLSAVIGLQLNNSLSPVVISHRRTIQNLIHHEFVVHTSEEMMNLLDENRPRKLLYFEQWEVVLEDEDIHNHFIDTHMCSTIENDMISLKEMIVLKIFLNLYINNNNDSVLKIVNFVMKISFSFKLHIFFL